MVSFRIMNFLSFLTKDKTIRNIFKNIIYSVITMILLFVCYYVMDIVGNYIQNYVHKMFPGKFRNDAPGFPVFVTYLVLFVFVISAMGFILIYPIISVYKLYKYYKYEYINLEKKDEKRNLIGCVKFYWNIKNVDGIDKKYKDNYEFITIYGITCIILLGVILAIYIIIQFGVFIRYMFPSHILSTMQEQNSVNNFGIGYLALFPLMFILILFCGIGGILYLLYLETLECIRFFKNKYVEYNNLDK